MMVDRYRCPECDGWLDFLGAATSPEVCPFCGDEGFEFDGKAGCVTGVSNSDKVGVQKLAEKFREKAEKQSNLNNGWVAAAWASAALDLEELIEDGR